MHLAAYYEMVTQIDRELGAIMQTLESTGLAEDTLVVFTSDNGLALGRHGLMGKQNVYEHSIGIPLIVAGPGVASGQRTNAPVYVHDIFPSVMSYLDLPIPASVTGLSFSDAFSGSYDEPKRRTRVHAYKNFQRALVDFPYKLIAYNVGSEQDTRVQLFNLAEDPEEANDLSGLSDLSSTIDSMLARMQSEQAAAGDLARFDQDNWSLPRINSWVEYMRANEPEQLLNLRRMAEEERTQFSF